MTTPQNGKEPTHLAMPLPLAQAIIDNLQAQPYRNVAGLIAEIQRCQTVRIEAEKAAVESQ